MAKDKVDQDVIGDSALGGKLAAAISQQQNEVDSLTAEYKIALPEAQQKLQDLQRLSKQIAGNPDVESTIAALKAAGITL